MQKFLVVRLSSLGDIILCSVVTQYLKAFFPRSHIAFLTKQSYLSIAKQLPGVDQIIGYGTHDSLISLIRELNRHKFDSLIDLHANGRSFWLRNLVSTTRKLKYQKRRFRRRLLTFMPSVVSPPPSVIQSYLAILSKLGIQSSNLEPALTLDNNNLEQADSFLLKREINPESSLIGIAPGARWQTKRWHPERFVDISARLQSEFGGPIIFFGNKEETVLIERLANQFPRSIAAIELDLGLVAGLMSRCRIMISNDSGLMHMATALKVPTVSIFGPTHPGLGFVNQMHSHKIVTTNQPCSPCSLHGQKKCYQPARYCMDNISVNMVYNAALSLLPRPCPALTPDEG
jgi:ADP-heptose:LPS heptosyltransferase